MLILLLNCTLWPDHDFKVKINSMLVWLFGLITNFEMTEKMLFQPIVEEPPLEAPIEVP